MPRDEVGLPTPAAAPRALRLAVAAGAIPRALHEAFEATISFTRNNFVKQFRPG
jgi:hypothetical protein